jgi:hypothetical protein
MKFAQVEESCTHQIILHSNIYFNAPKAPSLQVEGGLKGRGVVVLEDVREA